MAIPKIKATYSLDEPTVKKLAEIARTWDTSKSDALSRLINQGDQAVKADETGKKFDALDRVTEAVSQLPAGVWENWRKELREIHEGVGPHDDESTAEQ